MEPSLAASSNSTATEPYDGQYGGSDEEQACAWIADLTGVQISPQNLQQVSVKPVSVIRLLFADCCCSLLILISDALIRVIPTGSQDWGGAVQSCEQVSVLKYAPFLFSEL